MGAKLKGILELKLNSKEVVLYTKNGVHSAPTLDSFIYDFQSTNGTIIYLREKFFNPIYQHLKRNAEEMVFEIKVGDKHIGFTIKTGSVKTTKTFYSMKYKIGTDELDVQKSLVLIEGAPTCCKSGYTSMLRKIIKVKEPMLDFTIDNKPSLSPMIFAKTNKEFVNAKCFDITSFYPFLLTQKLPMFQDFIEREEMEIGNENETYYGAILIKKIKAKSTIYPLSLVGENMDRQVRNGQGLNIVHCGTRLISADEVILFGFIPFLLNALKEYDYEEYVISKQVARFKLEIDWDLRKLVIEMFNVKQEKKRKGENYQGEKILLNRLYGFFITKGNNAPAHYSQFIVQKGKNILLEIIRKIGLKDLVHSHTDSIKFVGSHEDVIEEYNKTVEFEELGKFDFEGTMEKVIYYGTNKAKYIMNGELKFKHGGIEAKDIEPLLNLTYEEIDKKTKYELTTFYVYSSDKGFYANTVEREFGGSLNGD